MQRLLRFDTKEGKVIIFRGQDDICTVMVVAHLERLYFRFGFRNVALFRVKKRKKLLLGCFSSKHLFLYIIYFFTWKKILLFSLRWIKYFRSRNIFLSMKKKNNNNNLEDLFLEKKRNHCKYLITLEGLILIFVFNKNQRQNNQSSVPGITRNAASE